MITKYKLSIPGTQLVKIKIEYDGKTFHATFSWNNDELNSKEDYEESIFGVGNTQEQAVGNLFGQYWLIHGNGKDL